MVDLETRPDTPDRSTRSAALLATAIAVPVAALVGVLIFVLVIRNAEPGAQPKPAATTAVPVPAAPVTMAAPALSDGAAAACLAVTSQLPVKLRDLAARKVSAGPEQNAAYGEPPITVACGVPSPVMCTTLDGGAGCVPLTADMLVMNRVCWWAAQGAASNTFTTMDREVAVQVSVPSSYQNAAQWANEFSDIVVETDKSKTEGVPSGCFG
jgi:hypothetical protein